MATTAAMDLTSVVSALMQGIANEVGVDLAEMKVILIGDEGQFDPKLFQTLMAQRNQVEWDFAPFDQLHHNPEPYIEIRLKQARFAMSKDPRSSARESVQLTSTKWGATALA